MICSIPLRMMKKYHRSDACLSVARATRSFGCRFCLSFCLSVLSVDKRVSQILNGHTGTFAKIKVPGRAEEAQVRCGALLGVGGKEAL